MRVVSLLLVCTTGLGLLAPSVRLGPRGVRSAEQVLPNNNVGLASNYWPPHRFLAARDPPRLPVVPTGFFPPVSAFAFWLAYYPLWLAYVWYFKPGPIIEAVGIVFGVVTNFIYGEVTRRENNREERRRKDDEPESRVRRAMSPVYEPPPAGPWAGPISTETVIADFVEKNLCDQTLLLVDETGTVKRRLLDIIILRGRMRVLAPAMEQLRLSKDISRSGASRTTRR